MDLLAFVKSQPHLAARLPGEKCDAWLKCFQLTEWVMLDPEAKGYMFSQEDLSEDEKEALPKDITECIARGDMQLHGLCPGLTLQQWLQLPYVDQINHKHYQDIWAVAQRWMREWATYASMTVRQHLACDSSSYTCKLVLESPVADMNLLQWKLLPIADKLAHFQKEPGLVSFLNIAIEELIVL
jgi:hypothetical protein